MAVVDYFLKIDGITGESLDRNHKGEIDVMSFSWGAKQPGTTGFGAGGAAAGRLQLQPLSSGKVLDKSSPNLFLKCASGAHIKSAVLSAQTAGEVPVEFLKITLSDVLISGYKLAAMPGTTTPTNLALDVANVGIVGPDVPSDSVALSFASVTYTEGPQQHIAVSPSASGQLAFDPKTGLISFVEGPAGIMTVGSVNGSIQRGVQEFSITDLIGLLTAPFSTARLTLSVAQRPPNPNDVALIASVNGSEDDKPKPYRFDVILYTPADGIIDASDLTRPGKRVGQIAVDPNGPPASLDIDLTPLVSKRDLDAFGIRLQLHGLDLPDPFEAPDDVQTDSDQPEAPRAPFSASFSLDLAFDSA